MADQSGNSDLLSNGSSLLSDRFKPFAHRNRYRMVTSLNTVLERVGSSSSLASFSGKHHHHCLTSMTSNSLDRHETLVICVLRVGQLCPTC